MKVAIYARVSSERQDVDLSISAQLKALREYASRNGDEVVREYVDEAESGRSIDRPSFKQMIVAARQKPPLFEAILVWKLSRFARNREDSIIYKSLLRKHGVQVISINEPIEDTPSGRLLEGIIEVIDEFYSANLSQDVTRGMRESASRGFYPGGPPPYGYRRIKVPDGAVQRVKLEKDPLTAPIVERMFNECVSGNGGIEIVRGLNADGLVTKNNKKWSKTSIHAILKNQVYIGNLVWGQKSTNGKKKNPQQIIKVENAYPAIVDKNMFESVQKKLADRAPKVTHPRIIHSEYILSGLIHCNNCNAAMIGHAVKSGKFFYYMCGNARKRGRGLCTTPLLPKEKIETFIIDRVKRFILTEENLADLVKLTNEELTQKSKDGNGKVDLFNNQIGDIDSRLTKLYDALETGEFKSGDLAPRIKALLAKKDELQLTKVEAEETLKSQKIEMASLGVIKEYVMSLKALLEESSIISRKTFLRSFIQNIEVDATQVKVIYTIPMPQDNISEDATGVLPIVQDGPPFLKNELCSSFTFCSADPLVVFT